MLPEAFLERMKIQLGEEYEAFLQSLVGCVLLIAANLIIRRLDPDSGLG